MTTTTTRRRRTETKKGDKVDDGVGKDEEVGERERGREGSRKGGRENRCFCQSQDTIVDHESTR